MPRKTVPAWTILSKTQPSWKKSSIHGKEWKDTSVSAVPPNNESGLKMEFYEDGDEIVSKWVPEARFQGWLNTLHGGIQATLLDEICAWVIARKLQTAGVTSRMETQYLKPIHTTDSHLTLKGRIKEQKRNFVFIEAEIYNAQDEVCTKAVCTYFIFPREKAEKEMYFKGCYTEKEKESL